MARLKFSLAAVVASLFVGYFEGAAELQAIVPNACPKYECKSVHALWTAGSMTVSAYFVPGSNATINSNTGVVDLFTPSTVEKKPRGDSGMFENWNFPSCNPMCGKDANGKWQAQQEVAEGGNGTKGTINPIQRQPCTQNGGQIGPVAASQSNDNTKGDNPPGVDADGNPIPGG